MQSKKEAATTTLHIKNMVCDRCKAVVRDTLVRLGLNVETVELGIVSFAGKPDDRQTQAIAEALQGQGFELLLDSRQRTVNRIKDLVIEFVHYPTGKQTTNLSAFLAGKMHSDYSALSKLFSTETGITIEKYFILQKIELVKELLSYGELSLSEIAVRLNYSSTAYLSTQFKGVTGITPSQFKAGAVAERCPLDKV